MPATNPALYGKAVISPEGKFEVRSEQTSNEAAYLMHLSTTSGWIYLIGTTD